MTGKRKPAWKAKATSAKTRCLYPALHGNVARLLAEDGLFFDFHPVDDASGCLKDYETCVTGRFICRNPNCASSGWSSGKIAVIIRMYAGEKYNVRVYYQRCADCNALSKPSLEAASYVERTSYRLKKWSGIEQEIPPYSGRVQGPHHSELCEGCRDGHCRQLG